MKIKGHLKFNLKEYKGIKVVDQYKYLGIIINKEGNLD